MLDTSATSVDLDVEVALYQTDAADGSNVGIGTVNPLAKLHGGTEQWWFKVNTAGDFTIHENAADDRFRIPNAGVFGSVTVGMLGEADGLC